MTLDDFRASPRAATPPRRSSDPAGPAAFSAERDPITVSESRRVREVWGEQAGRWSGRGLHWLEHPAVQARIHSMTGGSDGRDRFQYFLQHYFPAGTTVERVLTLGCGGGEFERGLAQYDFAREHDALDIAEGAIQKAVAAARRAALGHIHYQAADLNQVVLERHRYDVVFGLSAIHHISALERLRPDCHSATAVAMGSFERGDRGSSS